MTERSETPTTRANLDDLDRLAERATEGPWFADNDGGVSTEPIAYTMTSTPIVDTEGCGMGNPADAEFIAAARMAVPSLAAALRAVLALDTGSNRALYGSDFEAGMTKALWLVKGAIEQHVGVDR